MKEAIRNGLKVVGTTAAGIILLSSTLTAQDIESKVSRDPETKPESGVSMNLKTYKSLDADDSFLFEPTVDVDAGKFKSITFLRLRDGEDYFVKTQMFYNLGGISLGESGNIALNLKDIVIQDGELFSSNGIGPNIAYNLKKDGKLKALASSSYTPLWVNGKAEQIELPNEKKLGFVDAVGKYNFKKDVSLEAYLIYNTAIKKIVESNIELGKTYDTGFGKFMIGVSRYNDPKKGTQYRLTLQILDIYKKAR